MREGEGPMTDLADRLRATGSEACADYARLYAEGSLTYPAADEGCTRWEVRS